MGIVKDFLKHKMIRSMGHRRAYSLIDFTYYLWRGLALLKNRLLLALYRSASLSKRDHIFLLTSEVSAQQLDDIKLRLDFFVPETQKLYDLIVQNTVSLKMLCSPWPILEFGAAGVFPNWLRTVRPGIFDVDSCRNPAEGRAWCEVAQFCSGHLPDRHSAQDHFQKYVDGLIALGLHTTYVFGTGPSLGKALEHDWSDGYRIVCNTIVRDPKLWKHINPHFIAAGDPIYHFGYTSFPLAFRHDLARRLTETETYFIYPEVFHTIVYREFSSFSERLIPVPQGFYRILHFDMYRHFVLPRLGNILNLLLLPLACTLSKKVCLWGFDGRAPNDELFWSNSTPHSYPEFVPELKCAHPAFFSHNVPPENPDKYVRQVHGDTLDENLSAAEGEGWVFEMMHKSWTPTLQKRYRGAIADDSRPRIG